MSEVPDIMEVNSTFLCVVYNNSKLGIACFESSTAEIVVGSVWEYSDFAILDLVIEELHPQQIIASVKSINELKTHFQQKGHAVSYEANSLFDSKGITDNLLLLTLPGSHTEWGSEEKLQFLSCYFNFDESELVTALSALLGYLLKSKEINQLEVNNAPIRINNITQMKLDGILLINSNTLLALQIFKTDPHPSVHQIGKAKEGLSLFGIMNKCKTPVGKKLLRQWFLRPLLDIEKLRTRQNCIEYFLAADNKDFTSAVIKSLTKFKNVPRILARIRSVSASANDWCSLFESILSALVLSEMIRNTRYKEIEVLNEIVELCDVSLENIVSKLNRTIDFDCSRKEKRMIPKADIDPVLDELRSVYDGLDHFLTEFGKEEFNKFDHELVPAIKCVYYPQIGFLLAVPILLDRTIEEQIALTTAGVKYQFHTDRFVFYKSPGVQELDEHIGDIYCSILDLESSIVRLLEDSVIQEIPQLTEITIAIANLDCILAFAAAAKEFNWNRPEICESNEIRIRGGRHPLQELCVDQFIPNDCSLNYEQFGALSLLFGPNYSGKSVYMKQIGLICFMTLLGSFAPVLEASIGLIDRIFSRIHTSETSKCPESSFYIDLKQISSILHNSTSRSLVLIDEFGKGTLPNDGISLMAASIRYLMERQTPKCLVGSHFKELQNPQILPRFGGNFQFLQMNYLLQRDSDDEIEIVFLYTVSEEINESLQSWGKYCAKLAGIPNAISKRAEYIDSCLTNGFPVQAVNSHNPQDLAEILLNFDDLQNTNLHSILRLFPS